MINIVQAKISSLMMKTFVKMTSLSTKLSSMMKRHFYFVPSLITSVDINHDVCISKF